MSRNSPLQACVGSWLEMQTQTFSIGGNRVTGAVLLNVIKWNILQSKLEESCLMMLQEGGEY